MRWRYIFNVVGILTLFLGLTMIFPLIVAICYRDAGVVSLVASMGISVLSGFLLHVACRGEKVENLTKREGMAIVTLGWSPPRDNLF